MMTVRPLSTIGAVLLMAACALGCGDPDQVAFSTAQGAIVNGQPDLNREAVVAFIWKSRGLALCTGTLLSPRAVLTAGHCTEQWRQQGLTLDAFGVFVGEDYTPGATLLNIAEARVHPEFVMTSTFVRNDIGVVLLSEDAPVQPMPFTHRGLDDLVGNTVTAVGYGVTVASPLGGDGERRQIQQTVAQVDDQFIHFEGQNGSVCLGDSGGPLLFSDNGTEVIVGVASYSGDLQCLLGGAATRLDKHACFVAENVGVPLPIRVEFVSPVEGGVQPASFDVAVTAEFFTDVTGVELLVDGVVVASLSAAPWVFRVDALSDGSHDLTVKASSGVCGYGEASRQIVVSGGGDGSGGDAGKDAGPGAEAGNPVDPPPAQEGGGCSCRALGASGADDLFGRSTWLALALVVLGAMVRSRGVRNAPRQRRDRSRRAP